MRPIEFPADIIINAGQELLAAGRTVTGWAIRQKIGGGNPTRLKQVFDEHVNGQVAAEAEPVAELPVELAQKAEEVTRGLVERLSALAREMNHVAVRTAETRATEVVRHAAEQRDQAERELADAGQTVEDLETQLDQANTGTEELKARLSETQAASQVQAVELATVRERLSLTEQATGKAAQDHADELARVHAAGEAAACSHRAEMDEQKKAIQKTTAERDQVRAELATVKAKAEAAAETQQEARKQAAAEAHRAAERLTKTQGERDQATQAAATAREDAARLRGQAEAMQAQIQNLTHALAAQD